MKMDKVANSKNDEFYTPLYAIIPLIKHLKPNSLIWCPFDTEESIFVKYLRLKGHRVYCTHIGNGQDFFKLEPLKEVDYIISNPPYSLKGEVLQKLFDIGKPFAMLVGVVGLFESKKRFNMFKDNNFEIMYFDKRISYLKETYEAKPSMNPPFSSVYLCSGVLKQQIVFEKIDKKLLGLQESLITQKQ